MTKLFTFLLSFLFLVIIVEIFFLSNLNKNFKQKVNKITPNPTSIINNLSIDGTNRIIYQEVGDVEGRTVVYQGNPNSPFNNIGQLNQSTNTLTTFIGQVDKFESINGSQDEYISLNNPLANKFLVRTRIVYDNNMVQNAGITDLRVETIQKDNLSPINIKKLGLVNQFDKEKIHQIIKKGDVIIVLLQIKDPISKQQLLDEKQVPYLTRIIIRRFEEIDAIKN